MIISHKHKFIYLRGFNTASTSTSILLEKICGEDDIIYPILEENEYSYRSRNYEDLGINYHGDLKQAKEVVCSRLFKKYYKFTNVRNPWDREVSGYWWKAKEWEKR